MTEKPKAPQTKYRMKKKEGAMSVVAEAQLEEIPEIRVQNKVYDGRASKHVGQQSSQRGPAKSRNDSSYGSDSEVDDCQFDFEEQSAQDLRVP